MYKRTVWILLVFGWLFSCAPRTVPVSTEEKYHEDLSRTLPDIESYESPFSEDTVPKRKNFNQPFMDVTADLDNVLDSIYVLNRQIPYLRYTILVHNSNSREEAEEARRNVYRVLPKAKPKLQFVSPSYKVKVGNYLNKLDAYQTLVKLKDLFPNAVIVPEQVSLK